MSPTPLGARGNPEKSATEPSAFGGWRTAVPGALAVGGGGAEDGIEDPWEATEGGTASLGGGEGLGGSTPGAGWTPGGAGGEPSVAPLTGGAGSLGPLRESWPSAGGGASGSLGLVASGGAAVPADAASDLTAALGDGDDAAGQGEDGGRARMTRRTRSVLHFLERRFAEAGLGGPAQPSAAARRGSGASRAPSPAPAGAGIPLAPVLEGKSRSEAARMFCELLVLRARGYVAVAQAGPYGGITVGPVAAGRA